MHFMFHDKCTIIHCYVFYNTVYSNTLCYNILCLKNCFLLQFCIWKVGTSNGWSWRGDVVHQSSTWCHLQCPYAKFKRLHCCGTDVWHNNHELHLTFVINHKLKHSKTWAAAIYLNHSLFLCPHCFQNMYF